MKTVPRPSDSAVLRISAGHRERLIPYVREAWARRSLISVLSSRELKSTYEMNIVGFAWWMLEPLSLTLVYVILVKVILKAAEPAFPLYVLTALLPFKWMTSSLAGAMGVVRGNTPLIQDLYFPRALLPVAEVTTSLAHFAIGLLIVPVFMAIYHIQPSWHLLVIPVIVAAQFLLCLGLAYPMSVWGLYNRNLPGLVVNLFRLWLYLSPALWSLETRVTDPTKRFLVRLNPLTGLFEAYHGAIGVTPNTNPLTMKLDPTINIFPAWELAYSAAFGIVALILGGYYFMRRETDFGKLL